MTVRTVRHHSKLGEWEMVFGAPHSSLRPHVSRYCGYRERTTFVRRRESPRGEVVLIINLGQPMRVLDPFCPAKAASYHTGFVAGLTDTVTITDSAGESSGFQVDFTPIGARLLLGRPCGELTNQVVSLTELFGRQAQRVVERLREAVNWPARFAMMDALLVRRFVTMPGVSPDLEWAWRRLVQTSGRLPIAALAAELGCSRKHVTSRFNQEIGLGPKVLGRVLRFDGLMTSLSEGLVSGGSLAELAHRFGYYDQAHLIRDFRAFAGITPTEHIRRTLPDHGGILGD